jgi:phosphoribosylformylglycinamidine synthase
MLGIIDDPKHITTQHFKDAGDVIILLGDLGAELGGSEYLKRIHKIKAGHAPKMDLAKAKQVHEACLNYIRQGIIKSAHDCSEGGIAVALAESCMEGLGATVKLPVNAAALFGESQSRIIVSCAPENAGKITGLVLGTVGGSQLKIGRLTWDIAKLRDAWWNAIGRIMSR